MFSVSRIYILCLISLIAVTAGFSQPDQNIIRSLHLWANDSIKRLENTIEVYRDVSDLYTTAHNLESPQQFGNILIFHGFNTITGVVTQSLFENNPSINKIRFIFFYATLREKKKVVAMKIRINRETVISQKFQNNIRIHENNPEQLLEYMKKNIDGIWINQPGLKIVL